MFKVAAERVINGSRGELQDENQQKQHRQRIPALRNFRIPDAAPLMENDRIQPGEKRERHSQSNGTERDTFPNVVQRVMAQFVAKNRERLTFIRSRKNRVPENHAL